MRTRKRRKAVGYAILSLLAVLAGILVFFKIPYSKTKSEFQEMVTQTIGSSKADRGVFTVEELQGLPLPVRTYFAANGFIGTPKMSSMKAVYKNVDFVMDPNRPPLTIDYTHYDFVHEPARIAYIGSSKFGLPFEGLDSYYRGAGGMKGVLAKTVTLFDQRGKNMDQGALVTVLSESLLAPAIALQDFITWEAIDDMHAKATITDKGLSASGVFTFNEKGEMASFTTRDRPAVASDGTVRKAAWTAVCKDYRRKNGINLPTTFEGVWHYEEGDLVYFKGRNVEIEYDPK